MPTETATRAVTFEKRLVYLVGVQGTIGIDLDPIDAEERVYGSKITDFGEQFSVLVTTPDTATLGDMALLFDSYIKARLERGSESNQTQGTLLRYLFAPKGGGRYKGNICADGVHADVQDTSLKTEYDGDRRVLWVVRPEQMDDTTLSGGEEIPVVLRASGYMAFPNDRGKGLFARVGEDGRILGIPEYTTKGSEEAVQSFVDRGIPEEIANDLVSYWYSPEEGSGVSAMVRYSRDDDGPFGAAGRDPSRVYPYRGRLVASRSPSGARHTDEHSDV